MEHKITMDDLRNAKKILDQERLPLIKRKYDWGWIETDQFGNPEKIGLNKETHGVLIDFMNLIDTEKIKNKKIGSIYGMDVFVED